MSEQIETQVQPAAEQKQTVSHADMFFRYVSALAQAAGVQAFTMAVAAPREDGTSAILSMSSIVQEAHPKWKNEVARLLVSNALKSATELMTPEENGGSLPAGNVTDAKANEAA